MIKRAPRPNHGFLIIRNEVARDQRLSYRARGLLAAILSRPDNWTVSAARLAAEAESGEGIQAVRTALRELEKAGYLVRQRLRDENNRFMWIQVVHDTPVASDPSVSAGHTISRFPSDGKPSDGKGTSLEEPRRSTEEEDELYSSTSVRFAHFGGSEANKDQLTADPNPHHRTNFTDWRTEDRALFQTLTGGSITSDGSVWTPAGTHPADRWYAGFREHKAKPILWPGRYLEQLHECGGLDEWLAYQGLEATT